MGDICYRPVIEDMTWSYSRITCFDDCKYRWYLKYILEFPTDEMFFANYGKFIHGILEEYYRGNLSKDDMVSKYLVEFHNVVKGEPPNNKVFKTYFTDGLEYLKSFTPLPYKLIDVEHKIDFKLNGKQFVGIADYIGETDDGNLIIIDNKSRNLKPRSKGSRYTKDDETLDEYFRQLYLYAYAVCEEYGKLPGYLGFNCFRNGNVIVEPFQEEAFEKALKWLDDTTEVIADEEDFPPDEELFKCRNLCEMRSRCVYADLI